MGDVLFLKGKIFGLFLSIIFFLVPYPLVVHSAVFNVTNEEELRQALDTASSNREDDVINIAAGVYRTNGETFTFLTVEAFTSLTIQGAGNGLTILDGGEMSSVLEIIPTSEALEILIIKRLTIRNGFNEAVSVTGGGIYAFSANVIIEDCKFINNSTAENGGGIRISAPDISLKNNTFINNTAGKDGGGLFAGNLVSLKNNTFINNTAGKDGGGLFASVGDSKLSENLFSGNSAGGAGGGGALISTPGPEIVTLSLTNNIFNGNSSATGGGGLQIDVLAGPRDGGINLNLTNNTFTLNEAENDGGGIAIALSEQSSSVPPPTLRFALDFYNNITFNNFSVGGADDIDIKSSGFPNVLFSMNRFNNDFSSLVIDCSVNCSSDINKGNNINEDPLFVDAEAGDVSLRPDSPCIDTGDPDAPDVPTADIFGNPRVPPPDMGAVEFISFGGGGGCTLTQIPVTSSMAVFLAIPVLILIRKLVRGHRS
jgi:predicted outer membrane repeat protein